MVNMETKITAAELAKGLGEILDRVRNQGETFVIERDGKPVATLAPAAPGPGIPLAKLIERLGDLPLPDEGFADDLESLQASQTCESPPAWPS